MSYSEWSPLAHTYDPLAVGSIDGTDEIPHDHGVVRAMKARYKVSKSVQGKPECTVFVGRLNPATSDETLHKAFSYFGNIHELRIVRDIVTGASKCYGFIEYTKEKDADLAYRNGHKKMIDNSEILVDFEHERKMAGWVPRRLGGGFGGKKEAGQLRFGGRDRPFKKPLLLDRKSYDFGFLNDGRDRNQSRRMLRDADRNKPSHNYNSGSRSRSQQSHRQRSRSPVQRGYSKKD